MMQGNVFSVLFLEGRTLIPKCENFLEKEKKYFKTCMQIC